MWTQAHRARHDARLEIVSMNAIGQGARWLERVDPPRSGRATLYGAGVRAIAWHLRIGGAWRALPPGWPHGRTVSGQRIRVNGLRHRGWLRGNWGRSWPVCGVF